MELTAEQFGEIVAGIERGIENSKEGDRRRARRVERRSTMVVKFVDPAASGMGNTALTVTVRDFSSRGIGILMHREVANGTQFVVQLRRRDQPPISILCTAAHCRKINANLFAVGAEYTCILPDGDPEARDNDVERERISASILD